MYRNAQARSAAIQNARNYVSLLPAHYATYVDELIDSESNWDPDVSSGTGAEGLGQFIRGTWDDTIKWMEKNPNAVPLPRGMSIDTIRDYDANQHLALPGVVLTVANAARLEDVALREANRGRTRAGLPPANTLIDAVGNDPRAWASLIAVGHKDGQGRIPLFINDNGQYDPSEAITFYQEKKANAQREAGEIRARAATLESNGDQAAADKLYAEASRVSNSDANGLVFGYADNLASKVGERFDLGPLPYTRQQAEGMYQLKLDSHSDNNRFVRSLADRVATGVGVAEEVGDTRFSQNTQRIPQPGRDFGVPLDFNLSTPGTGEQIPGSSVEVNAVPINTVPSVQQIPGAASELQQPSQNSRDPARVAGAGGSRQLPRVAVTDAGAASAAGAPGNGSGLRDVSIDATRNDFLGLTPTPERLAEIERVLSAGNVVPEEAPVNAEVPVVTPEAQATFNAQLDAARQNVIANGPTPENLAIVERLLAEGPATTLVPGNNADTIADLGLDPRTTPLDPTDPASRGLLDDFLRAEAEAAAADQADINAQLANEDALRINKELGVLADIGDVFGRSAQGLFGEPSPNQQIFDELTAERDRLAQRNALQDSVELGLALAPDITLSSDTDAISAINPQQQLTDLLGEPNRQTFSAFNQQVDVDTPTSRQVGAQNSLLNNIEDGAYTRAAEGQALANFFQEDPLTALDLQLMESQFGVNPFLSPEENAFYLDRVGALTGPTSSQLKNLNATIRDISLGQLRDLQNQYLYGDR